MVVEWLFLSLASRICTKLPLTDKATEQTCVAVSIWRIIDIRMNIRNIDQADIVIVIGIVIVGLFFLFNEKIFFIHYFHNIAIFQPF